MTSTIRSYQGLEISSLVYLRRPVTADGAGHDHWFDAAVRIQEPEGYAGLPRSRVFRLPAESPFSNSGDARRACTVYAERLIDDCPLGASVFD